MLKKIIKINEPNKLTKIISIASVFLILLSLSIFGYYYYYKDERDDYQRNNFTISAAMANANKPGVIITSIIELILIIYLHKLRNNKLILYLGSLLAILIISILITILFVTPTSNPSGHVKVAGVGFATILIYNFLILSILYLNYKQLWLFLLLLIPNIIIAVTLIVVVCAPSIVNNILDYGLNEITIFEYLFAAGELLLVVLLLVSLIMLGFYKHKKINT